MASWQSRILAVAVKALVRRRRWGNPHRLARRARFVFGSPAPYSWFAGAGLRIEQVRTRFGTADVRGEWLLPREAGVGVVMYVHGGGFVACSPKTHRPITATLARMTGRRVFSVDYRLAPEHRLPAAQDDVVAAYEWLLSSGIPASSIALAGDSAGGNLVLSLVIRLRDAGRPLPACVVAFSPWTDLAATSESIRANDGRCAMFRPENMAEFSAAILDAGLSTAYASDARVSPIYADLRKLPPVLFQVGSTELLLDDSRRMHERILAAGGRSELQVYPEMMHCWQMLAPLVPEATAALRAAAEFIAKWSM